MYFVIALEGGEGRIERLKRVHRRGKNEIIAPSLVSIVDQTHIAPGKKAPRGSANFAVSGSAPGKRVFDAVFEVIVIDGTAQNAR